MAQNSSGEQRLVNVLSSKQSSMTAHFFSSKDESDYLYKRVQQDHKKKMQLMEHVMINRKDYYQTVKSQGSVCKSRFTIKVSQRDKKSQLQISKPFISGCNLKNYFVKLTSSQQTLELERVRRLVAGLLDLFVRGGGCPFFIYTLENIIINEDEHLDINVTSMAGFKFLAFDHALIKQEQFREVSHYLDAKVLWRRALSEKFNYELMQTNFAVLLLNVIFQKEIILINVPAQLKKIDAEQHLKSIKSKWPQYLAIKAVADRIHKLSEFMGVGSDLAQLFHAILVNGQYLSWGGIREMLFGRCLREENGILQIYRKIADKKWKSMSNNERQFFVSRKLVQTQDQELIERDKTFYLNMLLGLEFTEVESEEELMCFLKQRKFSKDYHSLWLFCLRSYSLRTLPEASWQQPTFLYVNSELEEDNSEQQVEGERDDIRKMGQMIDKNNRRISELYQIANSKLVLHHKGATFEQQNLKSLRIFLRPLRQFYDPD